MHPDWIDYTVTAASMPPAMPPAIMERAGLGFYSCQREHSSWGTTLSLFLSCDIGWRRSTKFRFDRHPRIDTALPTIFPEPRSIAQPAYGDIEDISKTVENLYRFWAESSQEITLKASTQSRPERQIFIQHLTQISKSSSTSSSSSKSSSASRIYSI